MPFKIKIYLELRLNVKYFLGNKRSSTEIMVLKVSVEDVGVHKKRKRMVF
jgi:hypothetical protein